MNTTPLAPTASMASMNPGVTEYTLTLRIPSARLIAFYAASKLRSVAVMLYTWNVRAHQRRALARLDGRLLQDVGMTPAARLIEISKPFWQA